MNGHQPTASLYNQRNKHFHGSVCNEIEKKSLKTKFDCIGLPSEGSLTDLDHKMTKDFPTQSLIENTYKEVYSLPSWPMQIKSGNAH